MNKVLVTGGLGFIGSHTCVELLSKGYEVLILDDLSNSKLSVLDNIEQISGVRPGFFNLDLKSYPDTKSIFEKNKIDSIIHFAANKAVGESVEKPIFYYRNNLVSLMNVLELSKEFTVNKFIFSSSCTVYSQPDKIPVTEETPIKKAESPYGNTKQIGEEMIQDFCNATEDFKAIALRYFNPAGAHESALIGELPLGIPNNLVPFITQTAAGIREKLNVFGGDYYTKDGTCVRDFIHVVDLAKAHIKALEYCETLESNYDYFNVGTGKGYSVLEVIKSFEKVSGVKLNYDVVERRAGDIEKIYAETSKVNNVLRWKAEKTLDEMMFSAWKWQQTLQQSGLE